MQHILVYTAAITPRLQYIVHFFSELLSQETWHVTTDTTYFRSYPGPKINYSENEIAVTGLHIAPHTLLFETGIGNPDIRCTNKNGRPVFFQTGGPLDFDVFAASFYLLSRYEEYLPYEPDEYGRYRHQYSLAHKNRFMQIPLVNYWAQELKHTLQEHFAGIRWKESRFRFLPTYDIDMAWSYLNKGFLRNTGGLFRDLLRGSFGEVASRVKVLAGKKQDPFYSFDWLDQLHETYKLQPRYFFLVAGKRGIFDKNTSPYEAPMQQLITGHAARYDVGLHPSWQSNKDFSILKKEQELLANITARPVTTSRQHFLKLRLPHTYRDLIAAGIREDYSMGYSTVNGFRASVATPFYWYDLNHETATPLRIYPFCFMDTVARFCKKEDPGPALEELQQLAAAVKEVCGSFSIVWHNDTFSETADGAEWRSGYEAFIRHMQQPFD